MDKAQIEATTRREIGSSACRQLRRKGLTPAVAYGHGLEPISLSVETKLLWDLVVHHGTRNILDLLIKEDGNVTRETVLIKEIQRDPVSYQIVAADFQRVSLTERITTTVAIALVGEPAGIDLGGVLQQQLHEIEIECLPLDIPEELSVDISSLGITDSLCVRDLPEIPSVMILTDPDEVIVLVSAPRAEEVSDEGDLLEEGTAEPELVTQKGARDED